MAIPLDFLNAPRYKYPMEKPPHQRLKEIEEDFKKEDSGLFFLPLNQNNTYWLITRVKRLEGLAQLMLYQLQFPTKTVGELKIICEEVLTTNPQEQK